MTTTTRTTKAGPISRTIALSDAHFGCLCATVSEVQGAKRTGDCYFLTRQDSDFGVAFRVEKYTDGEVYDVLLNAPGGGHTCDCKWGTYKGHVKPCRHIEICLQAVKEGKL